MLLQSESFHFVGVAFSAFSILMKKRMPKTVIYQSQHNKSSACTKVSAQHLAAIASSVKCWVRDVKQHWNSNNMSNQKQSQTNHGVAEICHGQIIGRSESWCRRFNRGEMGVLANKWADNLLLLQHVCTPLLFSVSFLIASFYPSVSYCSLGRKWETWTWHSS